jgi:suppressor of fused protein SUFU
LPRDFYKLRCNIKKEIVFFAVIPVFTEEMNFKLLKGADALFELFDGYGINEIITPLRRNVCGSGVGVGSIDS